MRQPEGFPLAPELEEYVGKLLEHWQRTSDQVKAYKCDFIRYDYDPSVVKYLDAQNRPAAYQVAFGEVRYAAKDRAMFETRKVMQFKSPPEKPGETAEYEAIKGYSFFGKEIHERWMCDGKSVYDFDFDNKRLNEMQIPPELQGNVVESPLPFLFGANKQDILSRFWVRYVTKYRTGPDGQKQLVQDEYWLEAYPKKINDSRMYSKLEIILAADTFMPKAIHMFSPQYNPAKGNFTSRYFMFQNRQVNSSIAKFQDVMNIFVKPRLPIGWTSVTTKMGQSQSASAPNSGGPAKLR